MSVQSTKHQITVGRTTYRRAVLLTRRNIILALRSRFIIVGIMSTNMADYMYVSNYYVSKLDKKLFTEFTVNNKLPTE